MARVLIVDDSPTETYKISSILSKHGYEILTAENGEDGIAAARKELPDVVLMDVVMPGLNGFQATKDQETDRVWGQRQGAKGYLTKPVDDKLLVQTIQDVLKA
jgi:twitching motility two-component system response regulator PilH